MRFTPASILLASALALSASSGFSQQSATPAPSPRAVEWMAKGKAAADAGDLTKARDAYETALLLAPDQPGIFMSLAKIARAQKLPGKAIRYYGRALDLEPGNQAALQGEGLAMLDKGAVESARETLAKLRLLCKTQCASADQLASAIATTKPPVTTAEAVTNAPKVEQQ
ncbi:MULTISPECIES: tetratricopeptide repeat protein [Sphingobium]|uniref:tetratricopeptide repeat protein n=1 Tax=Sphingobium TaxID=165695 RepID=UPI0015ECBE1E|nr:MULTISPECIES: tetratricopeptide repeat protein [Sphingobium]MCW2361587.1 cytochrome c-type biogenesis protein CcmH/NrfG [Sphingobium sp. B10D3B]MCW2369330.1 cytochrome c-type biogenesis protein CcmH/NrfG [Sphingobium sp. B11D3D]MCW2401734.1 cytochrome c-type biogenesis protein CcmH/NrfG [Sphingobium sp. B10D7B]MCW2408713.1 cytochrome c-type biogenesis protein CcmH/NrfG [Sphingobium xanthum]